MLFKCENITKNYAGKPVIENISIELYTDGFVSLLGPSGVGKTTLFNILSGVDVPDSGNIFLDGENITGKSGRVSYMLQKDLLLEHKTILDNVILPLLIKKNGENKKTAREHAASFFEAFGLSGYENKYPHQLSLGMRQRAALLRTCMMQNPVILLDEPFSALDAITRRKIQSWYAEIASKMKFSTFLITHDVDEALLLSDTIYILNSKPSHPAIITHKIEIEQSRPRDSAFYTSEYFACKKRFILETAL